MHSFWYPPNTAVSSWDSLWWAQPNPRDRKPQRVPRFHSVPSQESSNAFHVSLQAVRLGFKLQVSLSSARRDISSCFCDITILTIKINQDKKTPKSHHQTFMPTDSVSQRGSMPRAVTWELHRNMTGFLVPASPGILCSDSTGMHPTVNECHCIP